MTDESPTDLGHRLLVRNICQDFIGKSRARGKRPAGRSMAQLVFPSGRVQNGLPFYLAFAQSRFTVHFTFGERIALGVATTAARIDSTDGIVANVDHCKSAGRWKVSDTVMA